MDKHNRRSYLAPPAPRALNRDGSRDSGINQAPAYESITNHLSANTNSTNGLSSGSSGDTHSSRNTMTPTSGEIPVIATQLASAHPIPSGISEKSPPPPLSLEHLSLETQDRDMRNSFGSRSNRLGFSSRDNIPEPASAIEPSSRPIFPQRIHSANALPATAGYSPRNGLQSATMPRRTAPPPTGPPTGPLPVPPSRDSAGAAFGSPRRPR